MTPLSKCSNCEQKVFASAVIKVVAITGSPQHVALIYACTHCGNRSKVVSETTEWDVLCDEAAKREIDFRVHQVELDAINSAQDLIELWASYKKPPIREAVMNTCGCDVCWRKLYGN